MGRKYDKEYKIQAVKLAKEINVSRAAKELMIPEGTIRTWLKNAEIGILYLEENPTLLLFVNHMAGPDKAFLERGTRAKAQHNVWLS